MKKYTVPLISFIMVFVTAYSVFSFLIPSFRLKLAAEPMVYFIESIKHGALIKSMVSFVLGLISGGITSLLIKKDKE